LVVKVKQVKREKSTSTRGHYVTNSVLLPEVINAKQLGKVTDKLALMIRMIAERYSRKGNFVNYSFREDMVAAATLNLCNNALKFDTNKYNNPFSYYTTAIHHSFLQYIAEEKKHREIRDRLLIDAGSNPSFAYSEKDEQTLLESDMVTYRDDVMDLPEEIPDKKTVIPGEKKKEVRYRFQHREPSEGKSFTGSQMVFDEALGYFVPKVEEPVKKTRKKKEA
jgi:hypothetical protein